MTKKYELTDIAKVTGRGNLYRIRALKSFGDIIKGDLGGWVSSPNNLSQEGNCWVHDEACMHDDSRIFHNSIMHDDSAMYDNSIMHDNSVMRGNSVMHGDSSVRGNSTMHTESYLYNSTICDLSICRGVTLTNIKLNPTVFPNIKKTPIIISGYLLKVIIVDDYLIIGCKTYTLSQWRSFDVCEILNMVDGDAKLLKIWNLNKENIFRIAESHQTED